MNDLTLRINHCYVIIDVRTPLEFQEDRVPGSTNWPVLSNEERVEVGTLYAK